MRFRPRLSILKWAKRTDKSKILSQNSKFEAVIFFSFKMITSTHGSNHLQFVIFGRRNKYNSKKEWNWAKRRLSALESKGLRFVSVNLWRRKKAFSGFFLSVIFSNTNWPSHSARSRFRTFINVTKIHKKPLEDACAQRTSELSTYFFSPHRIRLRFSLYPLLKWLKFPQRSILLWIYYILFLLSNW